MGITLNWTLPSEVTLDNVVIYRATSKINLGALPAPLMTLAGTVTSFEDTTVTAGNVYYYVVSLVKGAQQSFSSNYEMGYFPHFGPGPQELLRGTWDRGYFGLVPDEQMFTFTEFGTQVGLAVSGPAGGWHKFIYKGKILFWPVNSMTMTWTAIYNAGLVFGDGTNGQYPAGCTLPTNVPQNKKVTRDGYEFNCRVTKPANQQVYCNTMSAWANSEHMDLLSLIYGVIGGGAEVGAERFGDYSPADVYQHTTAAGSATQSALIYHNRVNTSTVSTTIAYPYRPILEMIW